MWCGHELIRGDRFCTACGRTAEEQDAAAAAEEGHGAGPGGATSAAPTEDSGPPRAPGRPAPPSRVTAPGPVTADRPPPQPPGLLSPAAAHRPEALFDHLGLTDQPGDPGGPAGERPGGTRSTRWLVAIAAVLVVAAGGAAAALLLLHSPRGTAVAAGNSTSPTSAAPPSPSPSANPTPSPSPSPPPASPQVTVDGVPVNISAVNSDAAATAVAQTLGTYFGGIDAQNYTQAYNTFAPSLQASLAYQNWSSGLTTSKDTSVVVQSIQRHPNGDVNATVSFRSHQAPQYGPVTGDTCDNWLLEYRLVPSGSPSPPYLIKKVTPVGAGYQAC